MRQKKWFNSLACFVFSSVSFHWAILRVLSLPLLNWDFEKVVCMGSFSSFRSRQYSSACFACEWMYLEPLCVLGILWGIVRIRRSTKMSPGLAAWSQPMDRYGSNTYMSKVTAMKSKKWGVLGWPKRSFKSFCKLQQKNPNTLIVQPNICALADGMPS